MAATTTTITATSMYESFFSLNRKPFELVPNPDFLYMSRSHRKAVMYLDYAVRENVGFILLTGEVGSGKTTLIREMIKNLGPDTQLAKVFNTKLTTDQLIATINDDFGLEIENRSKVQLLRDLYDFLIQQYGQERRVMVIIDEAQNLSADALEELRLLSNLETDHSKLMQIVLVGQPELKKILSVPELRQLRQRISIHCHLQPLTTGETEKYVFHRLEVAGNRDPLLFSSAALELIHEYSGGIPRLINILCDFLLLSAYSDGKRTVSADLVVEVAGDPQFEGQFKIGPDHAVRMEELNRKQEESADAEPFSGGAEEAAKDGGSITHPIARHGRSEPAADIPHASLEEIETIYRRLDSFDASIRDICQSVMEKERKAGTGRPDGVADEYIIVPEYRKESISGRWTNWMKKFFL